MYANQQNTFDSVVDVCVNSALASIRTMTNEQLNELLYSDSRLDNLIDNLPQVRSLPSEREAGLAQNKSLAEWNLTQEPRLNQLKTQVKSLHEQATRLKKDTEELKSQLDSVSSSRSLDVTSNLLQVSAQEADDDAEALARDFENGIIKAELFMKDYAEKKTLAHMRSIKSERLMNVLRDQMYAPPMQQPGRIGGGAPSMAPYPEPGRHNFF